MHCSSPNHSVSQEDLFLVLICALLVQWEFGEGQSGVAVVFLSELETIFLQNECHHIAVEIHKMQD